MSKQAEKEFRAAIKAATKQYIDAVAGNVPSAREFRASVREATTLYLSSVLGVVPLPAPVSEAATTKSERPSPNRLLKSLPLSKTVLERLEGNGVRKVGHVVRTIRDAQSTKPLREMGLSPAQIKAVRTAIGL